MTAQYLHDLIALSKAAFHKPRQVTDVTSIDPSMVDKNQLAK